MRFSVLLSLTSRLTSLVNHAYQNSAFPVFVMDILVRVPCLLNLSEPVQRNTKIVELPRHKRKSFSTYFHLQKLRKRTGDRQYQVELWYMKKSESCYIELGLMFLTLLFTFIDGNAWQRGTNGINWNTRAWGSTRPWRTERRTRRHRRASKIICPIWKWRKSVT